MANGFTITKKINNSAEKQKQIDEAIDKALEECGFKAEEIAKKLCRYDTGLLKNSMTYALAGESAKIDKYEADHPRAGKEKEKGSYSGAIGSSKEKAVYIGTNVEYAIYVELGTKKMDPRHMIQRSISENVDKYKKIIETELGKVK